MDESKKNKKEEIPELTEKDRLACKKHHIQEGYTSTEAENSQKRTRRIDLTGQRFGMLTVLEPGQNTRNGRTTWLCRCDCGNLFVVQTKMLRSGKTWHCGCKTDENKGVRKLHYVDGTCIEMIRSTTVRKNSKSGHTGVFYDPATGKWRAEIMLQGKRRYLGRFPSLQEAVDAREEAKEKLHGEFLRQHKILPEH